MNTVRTWQTESTTVGNTLKIAANLGSRLKGGEIIELVSDLGGGKTTFVKGLATGIGSQDQVHSPSFTLSNQYAADKLTLYHFDFYRLSEPGIMRDELAEALTDSKGVVAVEWPGIVQDVLPPERITIKFINDGETRRLLEFICPASLDYLLPA